MLPTMAAVDELSAPPDKGSRKPDAPDLHSQQGAVLERQADRCHRNLPPCSSGCQENFKVARSHKFHLTSGHSPTARQLVLLLSPPPDSGSVAAVADWSKCSVHPCTAKAASGGQ